MYPSKISRGTDGDDPAIITCYFCVSYWWIDGFLQYAIIPSYSFSWEMFVHLCPTWIFIYTCSINQFKEGEDNKNWKRNFSLSIKHFKGFIFFFLFFFIQNQRNFVKIFIGTNDHKCGILMLYIFLYFPTGFIIKAAGWWWKNWYRTKMGYCCITFSWSKWCTMSTTLG